MKVDTPKQRAWSEELLDRATEFHGHGGPYMVVGLRMGLAALRRLDARGWFDLRCRVSLRWRPPDSCVIDGIQSSTGCTMGKHNIEVEDGEGVAARFTKEGRRVDIILRQEVFDEIERALAGEGEGTVEELMDELIAASDRDLFEAF
ncbi:hypothetical protein AC482_02790 [miscellaneous Crenarchaeota group-15 archaeon DG-45]|uniref:Formylmethanofuran dehydrogenase subunit E domain-containing protein n=1 Tax=miscellaneous Crenarchaeota group-15 archaeon DG-45 TaxID=1685127 RepID=A0A0M0BR94_9ARCH|nr:MAG: hypothetical protein AC482_02790 [miscellaneous Crenarchaeota group-15 archaeon DG-45]